MSKSSSEPSSESSSGVYKSKLFNFLNRRSQQLMNQSKTVWRHLQVATIWGVQIALYPVYLLVQTSRNFAFQFQESAAKKEAKSLGNEIDNQPTLPPSADQPITQVLELVKDFLSQSFSPPCTLGTSQFGHDFGDSIYSPSQLSFPAVKGDHESIPFQNNAIFLSSQTPFQIVGRESESMLISSGNQELGHQGFSIQGIASLINSQTLVLVNINNQVLDILTPEQQQKLARKITWEVANYSYDRRRFLQSQQPTSQRLLHHPSPRTLLPAKWFWRVMAWIQQGEVAIAANLFQESSLSVVNSSKRLLGISTFPFPSLPIPATTLQAVDQQVYEIELKQITPASQWLSHIGEKLLHFVISPERFLSKYQSQATTDLDPNHKQNIQETVPEDIWELIQGAIAYSFGQKSPQILAPHQNNYQNNYSLTDRTDSYSRTLPPARIPTPKYPALTYQEPPFSEDDWLTSEDLFPMPLPQEISNYEDEDMIDLPSTVDIKLLPQTNHPSLAQAMAHRKTKPQFSFSFMKGFPYLKRSPFALVKKRETFNVSLIRGLRDLMRITTEKDTHETEQISIYSKPPKHQKQRAAPHHREHEITNFSNQSINPSNHNLNNNYDWIETEGTPRGYVKHPLQKCLELLDEITLWIEKLLGQIWRVITKITKV